MIYLVAPERRKWFLAKTPLFESNPIPDEDFEKDHCDELEKNPLVKTLLDEGVGFIAVPVANTGGNNMAEIYGGDPSDTVMDHLFRVLQSGDFCGKMLESSEAVALINYINGEEIGEEGEEE